jgi:hydroxysqualene synthase
MKGKRMPDSRLSALKAMRIRLAGLYHHGIHVSPNGRRCSRHWPRKYANTPFPCSALAVDLLDAFTQDVDYTHAKRRYASREELLDYCRRSANPDRPVVAAFVWRE